MSARWYTPINSEVAFEKKKPWFGSKTTQNGPPKDRRKFDGFGRRHFDYEIGENCHFGQILPHFDDILAIFFYSLDSTLFTSSKLSPLCLSHFYMYIYTHIHTYIHTYIHIYIYIYSLSLPLSLSLSHFLSVCFNLLVSLSLSQSFFLNVFTLSRCFSESLSVSFNHCHSLSIIFLPLYIIQ